VETMMGSGVCTDSPAPARDCSRSPGHSIPDREEISFLNFQQESALTVSAVAVAGADAAFSCDGGLIFANSNASRSG
jgi:hypothetical protein